ncbi:ABC transporter permease [uncultured Jatrophihabitans sp.]|uniref:ABC transporter permease n=1 Tax=uncultured Jatrophihabitans sp. TaxID=1610747 RepID=UPI0035CC9DE8
MSAAVDAVTQAPPGDARVSFAGAVSAEWIKFRTLRSTLAVLGAAMLGMLVIGVIVGFNTRHLTRNLQPDDVVQSSTLQGYYLAQLLIGALGVLFVSGEYGSGMIRSSFAAVPRRLPVLWAKIIVFVVVTFPAMLLMCFVTFLAAQGVISSARPGFSLGDPGVLRVVVGTAGYLTLIGVLGGMLGWIVRNTPGALVAYFATVLVLPVIFGNVLGTWGKDIAQFMPSNAGSSFAASLPESPSLSPTIGLIVLLAWVAVAVAIAAAQLSRRDA